MRLPPFVDEQHLPGDTVRGGSYSPEFCVGKRGISKRIVNPSVPTIEDSAIDHAAGVCKQERAADGEKVQDHKSGSFSFEGHSRHHIARDYAERPTGCLPSTRSGK